MKDWKKRIQPKDQIPTSRSHTGAWEQGEKWELLNDRQNRDTKKG